MPRRCLTRMRVVQDGARLSGWSGPILVIGPHRKALDHTIGDATFTTTQDDRHTVSTVDIQDNAASHRFELHVDGVLRAYAEYNVLKHGLLFTHSEVLADFEGQGLGSQLARFALDQVRARGVQAIPVCRFIAGFISKHPEYLALVSDESRRAFLA
jgi:predicted GNAT family acetyltransferase